MALRQELPEKTQPRIALSGHCKIPPYCGFSHKKAPRPQPQGSSSRRFYSSPVASSASRSSSWEAFLPAETAFRLCLRRDSSIMKFGAAEGAAGGFAGSLVVHQGKAFFGDFSQEHFPRTGGDFLAVQVFQGRRILHGGLAVVSTALPFLLRRRLRLLKGVSEPPPTVSGWAKGSFPCCSWRSCWS